MARRRSSIDGLPDDIRDQVLTWLRDGRLTQRQVADVANAALAEAGEDARLSKSAVNRYSMRMDAAGEALRQAREVSEQWIAKLGAAPEGQIGRLNIEFVRTLAFELQLLMRERALDQDSLPQTIELARKLATLARNVEEAARMNVNTEVDIRKAERERIAEAVATMPAAGGMSEETREQIRRQIMMGGN